MIASQIVTAVLKKHHHDFHQVVPFDKTKDKVAALDLSKSNLFFTEGIYTHFKKFTHFIDEKRKHENAKYLTGGYKEIREMYRRSELFDSNAGENIPSADEPRSLRLGIDIWADAGTNVFAPFGGMVHSFAFNNHFGDYGATIILQHQLDTINFYTLYGHLSLRDIEGLRKGRFFTRGEKLAHFGPPAENGNWPPHLHFQLVIDMGIHEGDYPGVCKISEANKYLANSPDPSLLLNF